MVRERAGLRHQRFHDLRHAAGSILIAQGINDSVVQKVLGHSTLPWPPGSCTRSRHR